MLAKKLNYGDTVGVVGVSNSIDEKAKQNFYNAERLLQERGFRVKRGKYVFEDDHGSCGKRWQKAEDMMAMFLDDEVKAIVCLTGGDTANTFIDLLDYEVIKQHPKIFIGYSNVTVLLLSFLQKTELTCFSGPNFVNLGGGFAEEQLAVFLDALVDKNIGRFENCETKIIREGDMRGRLIGTNMASEAMLLGTEYLPDLNGSILAIENFVCPHNKCQYLLSQFRHHGVFDKVNGIIVGYNYGLQKDGCEYPQFEDWLLEYTEEYSFPIIKCNSFGHRIVNAVLPIGAEFEVKNGKIKCVSDFLI